MKFTKHPIGTEESQPRAVVVIIIFAVIAFFLLCAVMPFVWQALSVKP